MGSSQECTIPETRAKSGVDTAISPIVDGLAYRSQYIDPQTHDGLLEIIDHQIWSAALKRRVQHYGYEYRYTGGKVVSLRPLPPWAAAIALRLFQDQLMPHVPDQLIVNEYLPGQGIAPHVDKAVFEDSIVSVSLGSGCVMQLSGTSGEKVPVLLEPRSALILKGPARYEWKHSIAARKTDSWQGVTIRRQRRISLTFRKVRT